MVEVQELLKDSLILMIIVAFNQSNTDPYTDDLPFGGQLIGSNGFNEDGVNRSYFD